MKEQALMSICNTIRTVFFEKQAGIKNLEGKYVNL